MGKFPAQGTDREKADNVGIGADKTLELLQVPQEDADIRG